MPAKRLLVSLVICLFAASLSAQTATPRKRLSIDDPAFDVKLYEKAIQKLKDRDKDPNHKDDPNDPTHNGYKYFEELHNGDGDTSTCQHQNEIFLTWHRALLVLFERALQATYPGETDNLMLPYWNFGEPATGKDFPKAFERVDSPLYLKNRAPGRRGQKYTTAEMRTMILQTPTWSGFNGGECKVASCSDGPCARCTARFGSLEQPFHNQTHNWVGGPMTDDTTAAQDPIFWSFHTYIDLEFDCWQKTHNITAAGCPDCPLRALPGNWTPDKVKSTANLGYSYETANTVCAERRLTMPRSLVAQHHSLPYVIDVTLPTTRFATAHVRLEGLPVFPDFNYSGHVYVYPAGETLAAGDEAFRKKYFVDDFAVWGLDENGHAEHGAHTVTADVNASVDLDYLAKKHPGGHYKIAIVVDTPQPQFGSSRKTEAATVRKEITVERASVIYDRDYVKETP